MKTIASADFLDVLSAKAAQVRRPEGVTFELTYGCNLRCVHCYNPTHRALPNELTASEIYSLLNQIADLGVLTVTFTGGEPSVRPDIEHAAAASAEPPSSKMRTIGSVVTSTAARLASRTSARYAVPDLASA